MELLSATYKMRLSASVGVFSRVLHLAPASESGINVCQFSSEGCRNACLNTTGQMIYQQSKDARIRRTLQYFRARFEFMTTLRKEIASTVRSAAKAGMIAAIRLNGTSDLPWERSGIMGEFPTVVFYDYTKNVKRALASVLDPTWPSNYKLTFSRSGENSAECLDVLKADGSVAVVFSTKKGEALPTTYCGFRVINGDEHDARFTEVSGVVIGLRAKGKAKKDSSGFVVKV